MIDMDPKIKKRIQHVLDTACELADAGMGEQMAAREALKAQVTDVYRELAVAAIVGNIRSKARARALKTERTAMGEQPRRREQSWKTPEYYAKMEEIQQRHMQRMASVVTEYAKSLKVQWTQELLDSKFTLPSGAQVTWGDATREQHEIRAAQFERNAVVNAEGAARHKLALAELTETGCATLREAVSATA